MSELNIFEIERPWGKFRQFTSNQSSTVKILTVKPNEILSLQSHNKRTEFWRIIAGAGTVEINEKEFNAKPGDEYEIEVHSKHRLSAGPEGIAVLEIGTGEFDEADIVRYEDKYGRVNG